MVWGRGAIDMLNLTSTMAVATRRLAMSDWRPRGTLIYLAVADEEAGGDYGAEHMVKRESEAVKCDYVITESGGVPIPTPSGPVLRATVGEKGGNWRKIVIKGTPGHGSRPFRTDNALVTAAFVVQRLAEYRPKAKILDVWRQSVGVARPRRRADRRPHRSRPRLGSGARHRQHAAGARGARLHPHHVLARTWSTAAPR